MFLSWCQVWVSTEFAVLATTSIVRCRSQSGGHSHTTFVWEYRQHESFKRNNAVCHYSDVSQIGSAWLLQSDKHSDSPVMLIYWWRLMGAILCVILIQRLILKSTWHICVKVSTACWCNVGTTFIWRPKLRYCLSEFDLFIMSFANISI